MSNISSLGYSSIISYISFCLIFFTLKFVYFAEDNFSWILLFLVLSFIIQVMNNLAITADPTVCGQTNMSFALYQTAIPWICIFTVSALCLLAFPGWLRSFSNTFGLYAANAYGLQDVITEIFSQDEREIAINAASGASTQSKPDIQLLKAIDTVYSSPTTVINELDPRTMKKIFITSIPSDPSFNDKFNEGLSPITIQDGKSVELLEWGSLLKLNPSLRRRAPSQSLIRKLYKITLLKDSVGYFCWFILIGTLSSMISVNSIISSQCNSNKKNTFDIIFNKT